MLTGGRRHEASHARPAAPYRSERTQHDGLRGQDSAAARPSDVPRCGDRQRSEDSPLIRAVINRIRERQARKRLAQLVAQTASSYEIVDYRKRRAAAMKGRALKRGREAAHG